MMAQVAAFDDVVVPRDAAKDLDTDVETCSTADEESLLTDTDVEACDAVGVEVLLMNGDRFCSVRTAEPGNPAAIAELVRECAHLPPDSFEILISSHVNIVLRSDFWWRDLFEIACEQRDEVLLMVICCVVPLLALAGPVPPLHFAVQHELPDIVQLLLLQGADVHAWNGCTRDAHQAIHVAARAGDVDSLRHLINAGANPRARTAAALDTPLHFAACKKDLQFAALLLGAGADVNAKNALGERPVDNAWTSRMTDFLADASEEQT